MLGFVPHGVVLGRLHEATGLWLINASTSSDIDAAFASFVAERPDALFVAPDPLFFARRVQLANLASRHAIPSTFSTREVAEAGG